MIAWPTFTDLDGDRRVDVAFVDRAGRPWASPGLAGGAFAAPEPLAESDGQILLAAADFGAGDAPEIVLQRRERLSVLERDASGAFRLASEQQVASAQLGIACEPLAVGVGDLQGDGDNDLVLPHPFETCSFGMSIVANEGSFTWSLTTLATVPVGPSRIRLADFNLDGQIDVLIPGQLLLGTAFGPLTSGRPPPRTLNREIEVLDVDADGAPDVMVPNRGVLSVARNDGKGGLGRPYAVRLEADIPELVQGDVDGDSAADLVGIDRSAGRIVILRNETLVPASADANANLQLDECEGRVIFHRGDVRPDGRGDVTDAVVLLRFLFAGGGTPPCLEAADADNSGGVSVADAIGLLLHLFVGGAPPASPGPPGAPCGLDPDPPGSAGDLGCQAYERCT